MKKEIRNLPVYSHGFIPRALLMEVQSANVAAHWDGWYSALLKLTYKFSLVT